MWKMLPGHVLVRKGLVQVPNLTRSIENENCHPDACSISRCRFKAICEFDTVEYGLLEVEFLSYLCSDALPVAKLIFL